MEENQNWRVSGLVRRGKSHQRHGKECQDAIFMLSEKKRVSIALSDGAGSAKLSSIGSKIVTETLSKAFFNDFERLWDIREKEDLPRIISSLSKSAIQNEINKSGGNMEDYNSTLLLFAAKGKRAIMAHIGDGIAILKEKNDFKVLSKPENGEFANQTFFIGENDCERHIKVQSFIIERPSMTLFLMSDGAEKCYYSRARDELFSLNSLEFLAASSMLFDSNMMSSPLERTFDEIERFSDDDISMIVASIGTEEDVSEILDIDRSQIDQETCRKIRRAIRQQRPIDGKSHSRINKKLIKSGLVK